MPSVLDLSREWTFLSKNNLFKGKANLPSSNYTALLDNDLIKDPFYGKNDEDCLWVGELDWIYEKTFTAGEDILNSQYARLEFEGLDTVADVCLNGKHIASTDNAFLKYSFDIKEHLRAGENHISVYLHSPVNYVREKQKTERMPMNSNGITGFSLVRKPAYHFGWDWGPILPPSGIGDAKLVFGRGAEIESIRTTQGFVRDTANLTVSVSCVRTTTDADIRCALYSPSGELVADGKALPFSEEGGITDFTVTMIVRAPELWYANGMLSRKEQPLYTLTAEILENGGVRDKKTLKIGLREIKLSLEPDGEGRDFCFVVNGRRIFAKGANWIPPDSFTTRYPYEKLEKLIKSAADSNFNMIRVWGGGYYASDEFLDLCDRYGILVWHDFQFACCLYPFYDRKFLQSVTDEALYQTKRLRNRACLALLCGNNEIEQMAAAWPNKRRLLDQNKYFFHNTLHDLVMRHADTAYWPGSPFGGANNSVNSDVSGDTHIWGVWHGMRPFGYYLKRKTRFCSEFGFESLPVMDTIKEFITSEKDLNLHSPVMQAHQKCASGNERILFYMISNYRIPEKFEHLVYLSQLTQAESIAVAVDFWRRNMGRCNGALYWQMNDCWPTMSWSGIDYNGRYKALQYFAKEFFSPVRPSIVIKKERAALHVSNDSVIDFKGVLRYRLVDFDGNIIHSGDKDILVEGGKALEITQIALGAYVKKLRCKETALIAELIDGNGNTAATVSSLLVKERNADLRKAKITLKAEEGEDGFSIKVSSDTYARRVMLYAEGLTEPFSKNFFDIEAGRTQTVTLPKECGLTLKELKERLTATTFSDISPRFSVWKERAIKLRIALMTHNLLSSLAYIFT